MDNEVLKLEDVWKFEKNFLHFTSFYPKAERSLIYWIKLLLIMFFSVGQLVAMLIQLTLESDLIKIIDTLYYCFTQTAYLCKLFNFTLKSNNFIKIEETVNSEIFNVYSKEIENNLRRTIAMCRFVANFFRFLCLIVLSLLAAYPLIDRKSEGQLPLTGWYPVDKRKYYWIIYFYQAFAMAVSASLNSCFDTLASACICIGSIQFDILMNNFNIEIKDRRNINVTNIICKNVIHHNEILRYIGVVEHTFSTGIFVQFLSSIVVICMTGFQLLMVAPFSVQFFSLCSYFSCMMTQVTLYCYYGHEVLVKSSELGTACYMSHWYKFRLEDQKSLSIIMERSKRPVQLTAGKFLILSLGTLTMILRSSYSYFALLRHLYRENERFRRQV